MKFRQSSVPEVDLDRPNAARVYDYYLGGRHNFEVDRRMAEQAIALWPELPMIIRANRDFLSRAVRYLVAQGIRQFIDLGSGIPTVGNVHEIAQQAAPDARVAYVDLDPVAFHDGNALLADNPGAACVQADLRDPVAVLSDPRLEDLLDLRQPVAVLLVAVLHFIPDRDEPAKILAHYRDAVSDDSYLVLSHASADKQGNRAATHQKLYARTPTPMTMRSHGQITALLDGWRFVEPGLVRLPLWRPDPDDELPEDPDTFAGYAAVTRKVPTGSYA